MIEVIVQTPFNEAIGWALFHSLWQGALAALPVALIRGPARVRYAAGCAALLGIVCAFGFTLWRLLPDDGLASVARVPVAATPLAGVEPGPPASAAVRAGDLLAWLTPLWIAGVILFQVRTAAAWIAARRLRWRGVCDPPAEWTARLSELASRMGAGRRVRLFESGMASVPMVVGYLRPVILAPAGMLAAMPPEQIEAILLHELAHVRRHDYLVNLLQTVAEGLLFYHPAVWWISGIIRDEREHCCDDLAVAAGTSGGGAYEYALALSALAESRWESGNHNHRETAAAVAATGGNLMTRIHRLLYPKRPASGLAAAPVLAVAAAIALAAAYQGTAAPQAPKESDSSDPYVKWVKEDVTYIIEPREREAFLRLTAKDERERFIGQFWQRRDPTPGTAKNEFMEEHYRRIGYSMQRFRSPRKVGWQTDRGRIYIVHGPPDEIEAHPSGRSGGPPFERWLYNYLEGIGRRVVVDFVDTNRDGEYRQTTDPANKN